MANKTSPDLVLEFLKDLLDRGLFYKFVILKDRNDNLKTITLMHSIPDDVEDLNTEEYKIIREGRDNTEVVNNMITHHLSEGVFLNSTFTRNFKEDSDD
jgi:hypothetical protein